MSTGQNSSFEYSFKMNHNQLGNQPKSNKPVSIIQQCMLNHMTNMSTIQSKLLNLICLLSVVTFFSRRGQNSMMVPQIKSFNLTQNKTKIYDSTPDNILQPNKEQDKNLLWYPRKKILQPNTILTATCCSRESKASNLIQTLSKLVEKNQNLTIPSYQLSSFLVGVETQVNTTLTLVGWANPSDLHQG